MKTTFSLHFKKGSCKKLGVDQHLSCYITVENFVTAGVFFHNFNLKIVRSRFLLPISKEFGLRFWIRRSSSDSNF